MITTFRSRLTSYLESNRFLKNVLVVSGGTFVSQLLILLVSPIISRIYNADDFGIYQQYQSILGMLIVMGALRYDMAILVPEKKRDSYSLLFVSIALNIIFFLILLILALGMDFFDIQLSYASGLNVFLWVLPFAFLGAVLYQSLSYCMIMEKAFSPISKTKIIQSGGLIGGQIGGGVLLLKPFGLFIGDLLSKFLGIYTFINYLKHKMILHWKKASWLEIRMLMSRYKEYPIVSAPGAILNSAGFAIPTLLIGDLFGLAALGYFALVERAFNAPSILVGQSVSQVYMGDFNKMRSSDPVKLKRLFVNIVKRLFLLAIIPMTIGYIYAPQLFQFVFGGEWEESGYYFRLLIPMQILGFVSWPLIPTLNLLEKQKTQFVWELSRLICSTFVLVAFARMDLGVRNAILGYSLVMAFFYLLHLLISYFELSRLVNLKRV